MPGHGGRLLSVLSLPTAKAGGFRSLVGFPRLSGHPYTILGLTQHSSAASAYYHSAYYPGCRRTALTLSGVLAMRDSRGFFVLASSSAEVTPLLIPEGIRLQA